MLKRSDLLALNFYKKEAFTGSLTGMRYRVAKDGDDLIATVWPEPFSYDNTSDDKKQSEHFPYSEEGLNAIVEWLNRIREEQKETWENAPFWVKR